MLATVKITEIAEKKYIKKLQKKHKKNWKPTLDSLIEILQKIKEARKSALFHKMHASKDASCQLYKVYFRIHKSDVGPKQSGHRCIVYFDEDKNHVQILLVYSKQEIDDRSEMKIKQHIQNNAPAIYDLYYG